METLGHKTDQPGLRGHSHDPENDLMKEFVVATNRGNGWLWEKSFTIFDTALDYVLLDVEYGVKVKIINQYTDEIAWSDYSGSFH